MRPAAKVAMSGICTALSVLLLAVTGAVIAVYRKVGGTGDMSMF